MLPHRFAFNDTHDGYTAPYADWAALGAAARRPRPARLQRGAGHPRPGGRLPPAPDGTSATPTPRPAAWLPAPSHQPWWLLQNMSGYGGPLSPRTHRQTRRARPPDHRPDARAGHAPGAARLLRHRPGRLRRPQPRRPGSSRRAPGTACAAPTGSTRAPESSPTSPPPSTGTRQELFGDAGHFKMDLLHEGGTAGDVPVADAARARREGPAERPPRRDLGDPRLAGQPAARAAGRHRHRAGC